jgi:tryptophan halogenase
MNGIRSVVVAGAGPVAWITAAALLRAFRDHPPSVTVVDTGATRDARVGRWTLPSQRGMHGLLGIAEPHFMQHTGATFKLATEHQGWQGEGSRFLHAHGEIGIDLAGTPFYKFVQSEVLAGRPERPDTFSVAANAARLGRFARPMGDAGKLTSSFTYAFHVGEAAYTSYLRAHALRLGAREASALLVDVKVNEAFAIESLELADGSSVSGDYFIDCSGPEARLIGRIATSAREDWSAWLPCDGMWSAAGPALTEPAAITQTSAASAGWMWRAPLAQSSMVGHVFCSRFQDAAAARAALQSFEPGLRGEAMFTQFASGRRRSFWERNCVSIGAAAVELEPLAGADLHLAQIGIATLIELFPRDRHSSVEAVEYNRLMAEYADALRDFTLAHYRAGMPRAGDFWNATRAADLPARLAAKLEIYSAIGRIDLLDHESFEETDWAWLLMGSGAKPDSIELQIRLRLAKLAGQEVMALRTHVQQVAASMPRHVDFLRHQASAIARAPG